jgi:manganese transport system ATP-binding protein
VSTPALEVDDVTVRYGEVVALDGATLRLEPGRVCALVGVNGSGKSTLMRTVIGLERPEAGRVLIEGRAPERVRREAIVAYVPQSEQVDWSFPLTVRDVVLTGRYNRLGPMRRAHREDHLAVDAALQQVGLADLADRQIGRLSGGQRKRAFVARGIAQRARLLLLDEPFAGVDRGSQETLVSLLRSLAADGATVLVSTHDLVGVPDLADEAVLLMRRVLAHGAPADVLEPHTLAQAFGLPPAPAPGTTARATTAPGLTAPAVPHVTAPRQPTTVKDSL